MTFPIQHDLLIFGFFGLTYFRHTFFNTYDTHWEAIHAWYGEENGVFNIAEENQGRKMYIYGTCMYSTSFIEREKERICII